ncbi:Ribosomal RNA-processing protein 15 [Trinorchestia longiramus]|nr:Ribosomal RNA-processing protein 15 [Trinorchestia longiramus]
MTALRNNKISESDAESEVSEATHEGELDEHFNSEHESDLEESHADEASSDEDLLSQDSCLADEDDATSTHEDDQSALKAVMNSLLSNNKTNKEILSKASKNIDKRTGESKRKRVKPLEILQEDGTIIKVKPQVADLNTASKKDTTQLCKKRKVDLLFSDACTATDVVKEKKLRSLATKGVVQLFNTLEQHRQQHRTPVYQPQQNTTAPITEMTAITSGNSGLIDFLATKTMGGERQLFSEEKEETDGHK